MYNEDDISVKKYRACCIFGNYCRYASNQDWRAFIIFTEEKIDKSYALKDCVALKTWHTKLIQSYADEDRRERCDELITMLTYDDFPTQELAELILEFLDVK